MKKSIKKLQLHRESLRHLNLQTATGGATQAVTCQVDCSFVVTGCNNTHQVDCSFIVTGCH